MSPQTIIRADRTVPWKRGTVRSAGRPRSAIYQFRDVRAYAVTLDYFPDEDRIFIGYSIGRPLIPEPWMVAEEDPLEGLWLDPQVPVGYLIEDIPVAIQFLNPMRKNGVEKTAVAAGERLLAMLKDLDTLI